MYSVIEILFKSILYNTAVNLGTIFGFLLQVPMDPSQRKKWAVHMRRDNGSPTDYSNISAQWNGR